LNEEIFGELSKVLHQRRPMWTFVIEDTLVRIATSYFAVDWDIINEVIALGDGKLYRVEEVMAHSQLGQVICIRYIAGQ
jgi:hypothetical protein